MKLQARIIYIENDDFYGEGYKVEFFSKTENEWLMDSFFAIHKEDFIHFSIMNKIYKLQQMGYDVKIMLGGEY